MPEGTEEVADQDNTEAETPETKGAEETPATTEETTKAPADTETPATTEETPEAPEPVEYKPEEFTMPEGIEMDSTRLEAFLDVAKGMNLSQDDAQKLITLEAERAKALTARHQEQLNTWSKEMTDDKEFGGDKFDETMARGKRALDKFGDEGLTKFLEESGFYHNPSLVKMLARVDKALQEDAPVEGDGGTTGVVSAAKTFYPKMND